MHFSKKKRYNILFIEPFYGGSHKDFLNGLTSFSRHQIDSFTMKDRFWKWRMRGAALYLIERIKHIDQYDGIFVSDMINLSDLKALSKAPLPPILVYFHENQLSYPLSYGEVMDYQYGFTNIITALCADRILFNSTFHYNDFFSRMPSFLKMMPDCRPLWAIETIKEKADILYPGCHLPSDRPLSHKQNSKPPLIIWNHRWEHDKHPEMFFNVLKTMVQKKIDFQLALLGENFGSTPPEFKKARTQFQSQIVQYGYVDSKEDYFSWLKRGDIIVSTAIQENFGISVVEAMAHGCFPLLPKRLSYPELIDPALHSKVLYSNEKDLNLKLEYLLKHISEFNGTTKTIARSMERFSWKNMIGYYDQEIESLCMKPY